MSVRTSAGLAGRAAAKSTIAIVGMAGPDSRALIHAVFWLGTSPRRTQRRALVTSVTSKYQLSFQNSSGPGVRALVVGGRAEAVRARPRPAERPARRVEDVLAVPLQHGHEHLIAALGPLDEHGRHDRHHHAEEALAADPVADVVEIHRRMRAERLVVGTQERVVVVAARLDRQRTAEEVGHIGERRSPGDGLPVDHGQRPVGAGLAEQHVVEPVVTVDQAVHPVFCRFGGEVGVERGHQSLAHHPVLGAMSSR